MNTQRANALSHLGRAAEQEQGPGGINISKCPVSRRYY